MSDQALRQSVQRFIFAVIVVAGFTQNSLGQEENRSAIRVGKSETQYLYFAKGNLCDLPESGEKLIFNQSDYEVGVDTPKKFLGIFYVNAGVNFTTLTQDKQTVCIPAGSEESDVPEKAFLHTREMLLTLGIEFGFLFVDVSFGQMKVKGNYYLDNTRYDTDEAFLFFKVNSAVQFDLFSWGHYGLELSVAANPPRDDYTDGYINYEKVSMFIKILL